jgi:hypothetical protein
MCFHTLTLTLSLKGEGILFLVACGARALFGVFAFLLGKCH